MESARLALTRASQLTERLSPELASDRAAGAVANLIDRIVEDLETCSGLSESAYHETRPKIIRLIECLEEIEAVCTAPPTAARSRLVGRVGADLGSIVDQIDSVLKELAERRDNGLETQRRAYADAARAEARISKQLAASAIAAISASILILFLVFFEEYEASRPQFLAVTCGCFLLVSTGAGCAYWAGRAKRASSVYLERSIQTPAFDSFIGSFDEGISQILRASFAQRLFPRSPYDEDVLSDPLPVSVHDLLALLSSKFEPPT